LLPLIGGVAAAACIALNILLIPRFGMEGAAWATCGAYVVWTGTIAMVSRRHFAIRYPWAAITMVVCGGVVASLGRAMPGRYGHDGTHIGDVLISMAWVLVVFSVIGFFFWGRSPIRMAWRPASSAATQGMEGRARLE